MSGVAKHNATSSEKHKPAAGLTLQEYRILQAGQTCTSGDQNAPLACIDCKEQKPTQYMSVSAVGCHAVCDACLDDEVKLDRLPDDCRQAGCWARCFEQESLQADILEPLLTLASEVGSVLQ